MKTSPQERKRYCIAHNPLLFQPLGDGALVHIYIPQTRTPCGVGHWGEVLLALVGTSLRDCLSPNHIHIVPQTFRLVNTIFAKSYIFPRRYLARTSLEESKGKGVFDPSLKEFPAPLFCTLIVSYFKGFVKRFFTFF